MLEESVVKRYMKEEAHLWLDSVTGEYNCTLMAEDAIAYFCVEEGTDDYEDIFDWAVEVEAELEELG